MKLKATISMFITGVLVRIYMMISLLWASSNKFYHAAKGINKTPSLQGQGHEKTARQAVLKNNAM